MGCVLATDYAMIRKHQTSTAQERALEAYSRSEWGNCLSAARRILGNREDAEDAVQEAFAKARRYLHSYNETMSFTNWFRRILLSCCLDILRRKRRMPQIPDSASIVDSMIGDLPDFVEWSERAVADKIKELQYSAIIQAINMLPDQQRVWMTAYYCEGLSSVAVADMMGCSDTTARKRLERMRARVRYMARMIVSVSGDSNLGNVLTETDATTIQ